jgi:ligand-binding SRPBCC domain-containing protein
MISFETSVRIGRPVEEVFAFVSNPLEFPRWNSAVQSVRGTSGETGEVGSTYSMEREIAGGRVENGLEIFAREDPGEFGIRTTSGPTPFVYRYRFTSEDSATVLHLAASVELPGIAGALGPLAARGVRRGVDANFATLKQAIEARA